MLARMGFAGKTRSKNLPEMQITILEQRPGEERMITRKITYTVDEGGCHNCTSHKPNTRGYPTIMKDGIKTTVARHIYIATRGNIPAGALLCHTCDNRRCINPEHLFLGTPKDNMQDMSKKGRNAKLFGERNGNSKLTEKQVLEIIEDLKTMNCSEVGRKRNVPIRTVNGIKNGNHWEWLTKSTGEARHA